MAPYIIKKTKKFERSMKRLRVSGVSSGIFFEIEEIVGILMLDQLLNMRYRDHQLRGELKDFRECHIRPDLLLIYQKDNGDSEDILWLVDIGSHSYLFG